jgi:hypothetical protein
MPVFMTENICCHGNDSVKVATHKAPLKWEAKIENESLVKRNFLIFF